MARITYTGSIDTTKDTIFLATGQGAGADGSPPITMRVTCLTGTLLVNVVGLHLGPTDEPIVSIAAGEFEEFSMVNGIRQITGKGSGGAATYALLPIVQ